MLERDCEASLDRRRVQVDGHHARQASRLHELRDEARAQGLTAVLASILAGVAEVGHDRRRTLRPRSTAGIGEEEEFEQVFADGRAGRLQDVDVVTLDVVADLYLHLAVGKVLERTGARLDSEMLHNRLGQR
jgi:hypothetical protein